MDDSEYVLVILLNYPNTYDFVSWHIEHKTNNLKCTNTTKKQYSIFMTFIPDFPVNTDVGSTF